MAKAPILERIKDRSIRESNGCLRWTGSISPDGYGRICGDGNISLLVHRAHYIAAIGPIADDLTIDHLCRNRWCCELSHLEPVTRRENTLRGETIAARNAAKTTCVNGHPFDDANTYHFKPERARHCRTCNREAVRRYKARISQ